MARIVTTIEKWVSDLETLAWSNTKYINMYPYNLLYYDGANKQFTADCVNLLKALFNGRDINDKTNGSFQRNLDNTGDCTEYGLISQCTEVSSDFTKLGDVPEVLYMDGHIGTYLGKEVKVYDQIYNVIECTAWTGDVGHTGVIYSYVDSAGRRLYHKGGAQNKSWTKHGKATPWVDYTVETPPTEEQLDNMLQEETTVEKSPFTDVAVTDAKYKHIKACYDAGLINGYSNGDGTHCFKPKNNITREDACIIFNKLMKKLGI